MKKLVCSLAITISILLSGFLVYILYLACTGHEFEFFKDFEMSNASIVKEEAYVASEAKEINLKTISATVKVIETDNDEIKIIQYSNSSNPKLFSSSFNNGVLNVNELNKICIFCFNRRNYFEIYISKDYAKNLNIKSTSGDIDVNNNLKLNDINFRTTSGDINLLDVETSYLTLSSTSGEIKLNNTKSNNVSITTTSGDIDANNIESVNTEVKSTSGEIKINDVNSKLYVKTTSGDIDCGNLKGTSTIKSTSGEINVNSLDGIVEITTTSGGIKLNSFKPEGNSMFKSLSGDINVKMDSTADANFELNSTSGKIIYPGKMNTGLYNIVGKTTSGNIKFEN